MNNDINYFEEVENRAVLMSELIEEIIKLEDLLSTHKKYGSKGIQYEQYVTRKKEYTDKLNQFLYPHNMKIIDSEAAKLNCS